MVFIKNMKGTLWIELKVFVTCRATESAKPLFLLTVVTALLENSGTLENNNIKLWILKLILQLNL